MIPNGVILFNISTSQVAFANKEIMQIVGARDRETYSDLSHKVAQFYLDTDSEQKPQMGSDKKDIRASVSSTSHTSSFGKESNLSANPIAAKMNLWSYLINSNENAS